MLQVKVDSFSTVTAIALRVSLSNAAKKKKCGETGFFVVDGDMQKPD